jgi:hypothetical protein
MNNSPLVKKASGEMQPFYIGKLESSLRRVGADEEMIRAIADNIQDWLTEGVTTRKIYGRAFALLRKRQRSIAARYSLKNAIMELGPSGYPFEHFIGHVFKSKGFEVAIGQEVEGICVKHEVDVIATDASNQHLVECKFYNNQGKFANVQVPLYIRSRVDDIVKKRKSQIEYQGIEFHGWVVTNTRFTTDAMSFGECSGLNLLSWDYPQGNSLKSIVEDKGIFPVTALTLLSKVDKQRLLDKGIVLCLQILQKPEVLDYLDFKSSKKRRVIEEVEDLCMD